MERGDVRAERIDGNPVYKLCKQTISGGHVDLWRKVAAVPAAERAPSA
jgi:hypothetical protein